MNVKELYFTIGRELEKFGYEKCYQISHMDFAVRQCEGRNGEPISILEEFNIYTGKILSVYWVVEYDRMVRVGMIYDNKPGFFETQS